MRHRVILSCGTINPIVNFVWSIIIDHYLRNDGAIYLTVGIHTFSEFPRRVAGELALNLQFKPVVFQIFGIRIFVESVNLNWFVFWEGDHVGPGSKVSYVDLYIVCFN